MICLQLFNLLFVLLILHDFSVFNFFYKLDHVLGKPVVLVAQLKQEIYQRNLCGFWVLISVKIYPVLLVWLYETL